jgi:hypothetical protein
VHVGSLFVANTQSPKLIEPGEAPFDNPTPSAQPTSVFCIAHREQRHDVAGMKTLPDWLRVITTVT